MLQGNGVFLRYPEMSDYTAWAALRHESRDFLAPWEPTWAIDETSRGSYRYKLRRYVEDARDDRLEAGFRTRAEALDSIDA